MRMCENTGREKKGKHRKFRKGAELCFIVVFLSLLPLAPDLLRAMLAPQAHALRNSSATPTLVLKTAVFALLTGVKAGLWRYNKVITL
jgi:hypothetical protein